MPLPIITNIYRVALNWTGPGGQHAVNVMHFSRAGSNAAAVASAIDASVTSAMWTDVQNGWSVTSLEVTPLDGSSATYTLAVTGAKWTGTTAGDFTPGAAALVSLRTNLRGRSHRGRIYRPGIAEASQTNGQLTTGSVATTQTAWNTFLTTVTTAGATPVVASYLHQTADAVTSYLCELVLGTQRRRQTRLR